MVGIGTAFIERVPGPVERAAIALFGTADKLVLNIGIVVVALAIGAGVGVAGRGATRTAFVLFGVLAWWAAIGEAGASAWMTAVAAVAVVLVGLVVDGRLRAAAVREPPAWEQQGVARRHFLRMTTGVLTFAAIAAATGRMLLTARPSGSRADVVLPEPVDPVAAPPPAAAFEDIERLTPIVVANDDFYRIDTRLTIPHVDPETWSLLVTGMVERELELTYDELLALPLVERYVTIACVSNEVGGGLVGNAAWTGVPLVDVLERVGVREGATQIVGRAIDGWTAGFPTELALDGRDALIAVGMNGEPLPASHGFPARLIVPGVYGYVSATKWLSEIELTTWEGFDAYWVPRGWAKEGPVRTQSRIDVPRPGRVAAVRQPIAGVAWAPHTGVETVEVRVDGGDWRHAELSEPLSEDAWVQWTYSWDAPAGDHRIEVRATDASGYTQTAERTRPFPSGATGYHTVRVTAV